MAAYADFCFTVPIIPTPFVMQGHKIKYVNHNKQPNAFPRVSVANGDHRIGFYAKRDLVPGEEISIDYGGCDTQENLHIPTWLDASKSDLLHDLISRPKKR